MTRIKVDMQAIISWLLFRDAVHRLWRDRARRNRLLEPGILYRRSPS